MDEFKEYLRFPDFEISMEFTSVLEKHNIPYILDDLSKRFVLIGYTTTDINPFILKIRESDIERVEEIFEKEVDKEVKSLPPDHYLFSFSDIDILDIIANQKEWTKEEVKLALKIANDRKLDLSAQSIKAAKKIQVTQPEFRPTIKSTSSWFWIIAVFSIANSILTRRSIDFHLPGLATTEILENVFSKMYGLGNRIGFISCLIVSGGFFLFARYGMKNKWVFLAGLIIYSLDAIIIILSFRWTQILFISIAMWSMITGLVNTMKDSEKLVGTNV